MSLSSIKCLHKMFSWSIHSSFAFFKFFFGKQTDDVDVRAMWATVLLGKALVLSNHQLRASFPIVWEPINYWESLYPLEITFSWCNETSLEKQNLWNRVLTIIVVILFIHVAFSGCKTWILQRLYCCVCGFHGTDMSTGWEEHA